MKRLLLTMMPSQRRTSLEHELGKQGFLVFEANSGEQAIDRFVTARFDALIVHIDLPGRDGAATIESVRWAPGGKEVPTVLIGGDQHRLARISAALGLPSWDDDDPEAIASSLASRFELASPDSSAENARKTNAAIRAQFGSLETQPTRAPAAEKRAFYALIGQTTRVPDSRSEPVQEDGEEWQEPVVEVEAVQDDALPYPQQPDTPTTGPEEAETATSGPQDGMESADAESESLSLVDSCPTPEMSAANSETDRETADSTPSEPIGQTGPETDANLAIEIDVGSAGPFESLANEDHSPEDPGPTWDDRTLSTEHALPVVQDPEVDREYGEADHGLLPAGEECTPASLTPPRPFLPAPGPISDVDIDIREAFSSGEVRPLPSEEAEADDVSIQRAQVHQNARLAGSLEGTAFAELLARLAEQRATGAMVVESQNDPRKTVRGGPATKVLFVRSGVPVSIQSNLEEECLGQVLLRAGVITEAQLKESIRLVRAGDGKQGGLLIAMGALSPDEMRTGLEDEQMGKLLELFSWQEGTFHFSESQTPPPATVAFEFSLASLLFRGIESQMPLGRVSAALKPHLKKYVSRTERGTYAVEQCLNPGGRALLDSLDGTTSVQTLIDSGQPNRPAVLRILYILQILGTVAFREQPGTRSQVNTDEKNADDMALTHQIMELGEKLREGRYAEALGVQPGDRLAAARAVSELESGLRDAMEQRKLSAPLQSTTLEILARLPRAALAVGAAQAGRGWRPVPTVPLSATVDRLPSLAPPTPPALVQAEALNDRMNTMLHAERFFRRGQRFYSRGRTEEARPLFERAHEIAPDEGEFLSYLGMARHEMGVDRASRMQALDELRRATVLVPKMYLAHLHLARALRDEGEFNAARDAYTRALETNPSGVEALDELHDLPAL